MRIIYGHDYYDNALAFGRDESIVFVRQREQYLAEKAGPFALKLLKLPMFEFWLQEKKSRSIPYYRHRYQSGTILEKYKVRDVVFDVQSMVVIFCGKIYTGIKLNLYTEYYSLRGTTYFWSLESFQAWLDQMDLQVVKKRWHYRYVKNRDPDRTIDLKAFFAVTEGAKPLIDWLIENKVVMAIWHPYPHVLRHEGQRNQDSLTWDINSDRLKDVQFFKMVDPYSAFQEISMWVGGVLPGSGANMVEVSDSVRIEKHGFDRRTSFRNMKRD